MLINEIEQRAQKRLIIAQRLFNRERTNFSTDFHMQNNEPK